MEDEDLLLSEVHANSRPTPTPTPTAATTATTSTHSHATTVFVASALDCDGDLVLPRKGHNKITQQGNDGDDARAASVVIRHSMATRLRAVGLQVWTGALLLAEWVLSNKRVCCGVTAIELGAGPGLVGIVLAQVASRVFLTDAYDDVLTNCLANVLANTFETDIARMRRLDWTKPLPTAGEKEDEFAWSEGDIGELRDVTLVLAADTIYDDNATDAFFVTLKWLLGFGKQKVLIIALEKRVNFSADDLDIKAPAYSHFRSHFLDMGICDDNTHGNTPDISKLFVGHRIGIDTIPQRFGYDRSEYLEVWELGLRDSESLGGGVT